MKLTWRKVLDEERVTLHYQSDQGHRILPQKDQHGKTRGYKIKFRGHVSPMIATLYAAKWRAEHGKKW